MWLASKAPVTLTETNGVYVTDILLKRGPLVLLNYCMSRESQVKVMDCICSTCGWGHNSRNTLHLQHMWMGTQLEEHPQLQSVRLVQRVRENNSVPKYCTAAFQRVGDSVRLFGYCAHSLKRLAFVATAAEQKQTQIFPLYRTYVVRTSVTAKFIGPEFLQGFPHSSHSTG
jgi:hypothetical protein